MDTDQAVQEYQCPGCVKGPWPDCYKIVDPKDGFAGEDHVAGTMMMPGIGSVFLGLPKGFNRLGAAKSTRIYIFKNFDDSWGYTLFNVPVWKYFDENGNTIVRGLSPRVNIPWIHIFLCDCIGEISCYQITQKDLDRMD